MINCGEWHIGVCTWSLGNDFDKIDSLREQTGLNHIHLAVLPALGDDGDKYLSKVKTGGWNITAVMINFPQEDYSTLESIKITGGIVPDKDWTQNRKMVFDSIDVTAELGVKYLSLHFGFIDPANPDNFKKLCDRAKTLADRAARKNIQMLLETGQEKPGELREFLEELDHPAIGVNFDPANVILYDKGDPIKAVQTLAGWIRHVHIKDAVRTKVPGMWGTEVVWGTGQAGGAKFLRALEKINFAGALAVEREAGDDRFGDVKIAVDKLKGFKL